MAPAVESGFEDALFGNRRESQFGYVKARTDRLRS
jgi:hypothetical protein